MVKILTPEQLEAHNHYLYVHAFKGFTIGCVASLGIYRFVSKRYPAFNKLPYTLKTFTAIVPPIVGVVTAGEAASIRFDKIVYKSGEYSDEAIKEQLRIKRLPISERLTEYVMANKFTMITGAWAASMWASWEWVNRDKIMTKSQKIVQARMYAQSLTVILVLGSVLLTVYEEERHPEKYGGKTTDNSWKTILEEEEKEEEEAAAALSKSKKPILQKAE